MYQKRDLSFSSGIDLCVPDISRPNSTDYETTKLSLGVELNEGREFGNAASMESLNYGDRKTVKSPSLVIEDVTHGTGHRIPSSSSVVLFVEHTSPKEMEVTGNMPFI